MNIAIVGATGNVGRKTLEVLEKKGLPIENLYLLASSRSTGKKISFKGKDYNVSDLESFDFSKALKTAMGMSFISMISMEIMMNLTDYFLTGGAILTWWVVPIMLLVGFLTPWPYNYWRLKKFNIACH